MNNLVTAAPLIFFAALTSNAALHTFHYSNGATIAIEALSRAEAYRGAATICFAKLTGGIYPGEEVGLDIIDTCANPTNYK
jgi:hypothetical protein